MSVIYCKPIIDRVFGIVVIFGAHSKRVTSPAETTLTAWHTATGIEDGTATAVRSDSPVPKGVALIKKVTLLHLHIKIQSLQRGNQYMRDACNRVTKKRHNQDD